MTAAASRKTASVAPAPKPKSIVRRFDAGSELLEQAADRAADAALAVPSGELSSEAGQRPPRRAAGVPSRGGELPSSVARTLAGSGTPIERGLRENLEQRFGHDFSRVRVHANRDAAQSALDVDAQAYTVGEHIVFGSGRFAPGTRDGRRLLAHELAHVVQQSNTGGAAGSATGVLQRKPRSDAQVTRHDAEPLPQENRLDPPATDGLTAPRPEAAPAPESDGAEALRAPPQVEESAPGTAQAPGRQPATTVGDPAALPVPEDAGIPAKDEQDAAVRAPDTGNDSVMPPLTELLGEPQVAALAIDSDAGEVAIESDSAADIAVAPGADVDRAALLAALAQGAGQARTTITGHSSVACAAINHCAKSLHEKVKQHATSANMATEGRANEQRTKLEKAISATAIQIGWAEKACKKKAGEYADNAKKAQTEGFAFYRGLLSGAFEHWIRYTETIRDFEIKRLKRKTSENSVQALHKAELYDKRFIKSNKDQSEGRKQVQRDAAYDVADKYIKEFEKVEPEVIPEITSACARVTTELVKNRDLALVEFDKPLPEVLSGIDDQRKEAEQDIAAKAAESNFYLATAAVGMRTRIGQLETTALERNTALHVKVDAQIETGRAGAEQQFQRGIPKAMEPIAAILDEAVGLLMNDEADLDTNAAALFVGEVVDFSLEAADATGAVFAAARDTAIEKLGTSAPFARRGFAAGKKDFDSILRSDGVDNEVALIHFGLATDEYLGSTLTILDQTCQAAIEKSATILTPLVNEVRQKLRESMKTATDQIHQAVSDVVYEQYRALRRMFGEMHAAARKAAWKYDHPVKDFFYSLLAVTLGFIFIVALLIAVIASLILIFGELAVLIAFAVVGGFLAGYFGAKAYDEKKKEGAHWLVALGHAVAEVTGINEVRRAFTDSKMEPFERGMAWGSFWLGLWGPATKASKFFAAIKLRLPKVFTNPFRLKRPPVVTAMADLPKPQRIGFKLPHEQTPTPEIPAPAAKPRGPMGFLPENKRVPAPEVPDVPPVKKRGPMGFLPENKRAPVPEVPDVPPVKKRGPMGFLPENQRTPAPDAPAAPVGSPKRQIGFVSSEKPPSKPVAPDGPAQPRANVDGAPARPGPGAPAGDAPSGVIADMPAAREVQSTPAPRGGAAGQRAGPRVDAPAETPTTAGPRTPKGEPPLPDSPNTGKVLSAVEPAVPAEVTPATPAAPAPASRSTAAAKGVAETEHGLETARTKRTADETSVNKLNEELEATEKLRKALGGKSKSSHLDDALKNTRRDLATAKDSLKRSIKAEKDARAKVKEATETHEQVRALEEQIAETGREPYDMEGLGVPAETPQMVGKNLGAAKLKPGQKAVYILREAGGKILKVGKTSFKGIKQRARKYTNAAREKNIEVEWEVYPLEKPPKGTRKPKSAEFYEKKVRDALKGEEMPWDNTGGRLGRKGFGTPGEGVRRSKIPREEMEALLRKHKGNVDAAGRELGKHGQTVRLWAKSLGLDPKDFKTL